MYKSTILFLLIGLFILLMPSAFAQKAPNGYQQPKYVELPLGSIKPKGWLLNQLQMMRKGSTGHLDEVYRKVAADNGWLGGKGDDWEETPYWLDGAVPLAYLLNDTELKEKVAKYINWTLDHQRPSGYFGPITDWERETGKFVTAETCDKGEDWWPRMVMLKVLKQYYTATDDARVLPFMTKYFKYQQKVLKNCPIGKWTEWAQSRGHDNMLVAQWLYAKTGDASLLQLSSLIQTQTFPWSRWLGNRDWVINAAVHQNDSAWMSRHGVNVAMALKEPAIHYQRTGDNDYLKALKTGFTDLMTLHGLPMGVFSADEDLHGNSPEQGTELCAIVEAQYSLEEIIAITGDPFYMEALERMTFNALPAQTTDDYNNKQYFQVANQVQVEKGVYQFSLPFEREMNNVFGMRSGYTCCLANMHQGWTKFTTHLWYGTPQKGLAALHYSPNVITAKVGKAGTEITIREETAYPFSDVVKFVFDIKKEVSFPLQLRIPAWCAEAIILLNGKEWKKEKGGQLVTVERTWKGGDVVSLQLPMQVTTSNWGKNSRAIERGPLVYALKLEEVWNKATDEKEGDYYTVHPKGDWNYGIVESVVKAPVQNTEVKKVNEGGADFIWNLAHAPFEITLGAKKILDWKVVNDVAPQPVTDRTGFYKGAVNNEVEKITLVPYGCTKVRIVAFPVVR